MAVLTQKYGLRLVEKRIIHQYPKNCHHSIVGYFFSAWEAKLSTF